MKRHWIVWKWNKLRDRANGRYKQLRAQLLSAGDYRDSAACDRISAQAWDRYGEYW